MTSLDREKFTSTFQVHSLELKNLPVCEIMPVLKKYLLKFKHWKSVEKSGNGLVVYLDPEKIETFDDFDEKDRIHLLKYVNRMEKRDLTLKYENWSADAILRAILPDDVEVPTSYTKVGHIVHLNLRENQLPFKKLIGQVYLDHVPQTRVVVNKLNNIDTEFRFFSMEILAGENDTITTVKENNCQFKFDFAKVYWNSRLATEHERLIECMKKGDTLYDVFAGVGPFSIPAARKGITVLANDLNPESYRWLKENATANKVKNFNCFNQDGRIFLREHVKSHLLKRRHDNADGFEHIAMNLPALAIEFLDVFSDWMDQEEIKLVIKNPPLVHLYCFVRATKSDDPKIIAQEIVEEQLNIKFTSESLKMIQYVRNVAPNKEMMRVSFYLTEEIMSCKKSNEPPTKRPKIHNEFNNIVGQDGQQKQ
uniref:tRNA (guanine(37)-N1)-methyltransferase n=1 Tax=Bracon brevicornis TaxID=1563983 RepID=A0A6V7L5G4_9HYME